MEGKVAGNINPIPNHQTYYTLLAYFLKTNFKIRV
jgi:hypothetical protein